MSRCTVTSTRSSRCCSQVTLTSTCWKCSSSSVHFVHELNWTWTEPRRLELLVQLRSYCFELGWTPATVSHCTTHLTLVLKFEPNPQTSWNKQIRPESFWKLKKILMTQQSLLQKDLNDISLVYCQRTLSKCYMSQGVATLPLLVLKLSLSLVKEISISYVLTLCFLHFCRTYLSNAFVLLTWSTNWKCPDKYPEFWRFLGPEKNHWVGGCSMSAVKNAAVRVHIVYNASVFMVA